MRGLFDAGLLEGQAFGRPGAHKRTDTSTRATSMHAHLCFHAHMTAVRTRSCGAHARMFARLHALPLRRMRMPARAHAGHVRHAAYPRSLTFTNDLLACTDTRTHISTYACTLKQVRVCMPTLPPEHSLAAILSCMLCGV